MRNFRKLLLVCLTFILCVALISAASILPMLGGEYAACQDQSLRNSLAGTIDFLVLGASHATHSLMPEVLDEKLGVKSYNLSGAGLTIPGRTALLKKELERNPVGDIVLEISFNTLMKVPVTDHYEGDLYMLTRLDTHRERWAYFKENIPFADWDLAYAMLMRFSAAYWQAKLTGAGVHNVIYADKGYEHGDSNDLTRLSSLDAEPLDAEMYAPSAEGFRALIKMAKLSGANVTVVSVPVSMRKITSCTGWDEVMGEISALCAEEGVCFYDFNLYRERKDLFPDETAYHDEIHMSDAGAKTFSALFSELYPAMRKNTDISALFYENYARMLAPDC